MESLLRAPSNRIPSLYKPILLQKFFASHLFAIIIRSFLCFSVCRIAIAVQMRLLLRNWILAFASNQELATMKQFSFDYRSTCPVYCWLTVEHNGIIGGGNY